MASLNFKEDEGNGVLADCGLPPLTPMLEGIDQDMSFTWTDDLSITQLAELMAY